MILPKTKKKLNDFDKIKNIKKFNFLLEIKPTNTKQYNLKKKRLNIFILKV
jgi:hypothetical protein